MSPKKNSSARGSMWVDLRLPFAITVAEGLLLLGLVALMAYLKLPRLPLIALAVLVFYLVTAGAILLSYVLRYAEMKRAEEAAEQLFSRALFDDALIHATCPAAREAVLVRASEVLGEETSRDMAEVLGIDAKEA